MTEHVIVSDETGIRTILMNRPEKKNALTLAMYDAMTDALESASANDAVRCVVFTGVPGAFSAGNDLADFLAATQGTGRWSAQALRFLPALVHCRKPLVAAVSGVAVGIGTTWRSRPMRGSRPRSSASAWCRRRPQACWPRA